MKLQVVTKVLKMSCLRKFLEANCALHTRYVLKQARTEQINLLECMYMIHQDVESK